MQAELKSKTSVLVVQLMKQRLPCFEIILRDQPVADILFMSKSDSPLTFFINFCISQKRDAFTVELAWSEAGKWPKDSGAVPRSWPELGIVATVPAEGELRFRLTKLWLVPKKDPWWEIVPRPTLGDLTKYANNPTDVSFLNDISFDEKVSRLERLTKDAIDKISEYGMGYFTRIAVEHDVTWPPAPAQPIN